MIKQDKYISPNDEFSIVAPSDAMVTKPSENIQTSEPIIQETNQKRITIDVDKNGILKWSVIGDWTYVELIGQLESVKLQIAQLSSAENNSSSEMSDAVDFYRKIKKVFQ